MAQTETVYYTRSSHGSHPVVVLPPGEGFEVRWPQGPVRYPSARRTLIAITNRNPDPGPKSKGWEIPFNRYFRIGKYSGENTVAPEQDIFTLFSPTILVPKSLPTIIVPNTTRGIDLAKRGHEVRKLFYAGFARRVVNQGHDPEEMLQEIYKGILIRNQGKCPFDPAKSSFGHYVHMICNCIIINYHKRWSRIYGEEQYGIRAADGSTIDVGEADLPCPKLDSEHHSGRLMALRAISDEAISAAYELDADPDLTLKCVQALSHGLKRIELEAWLAPTHRPFQIDKAYRAAKQAAESALRSS